MPRRMRAGFRRCGEPLRSDAVCEPYRHAEDGVHGVVVLITPASADMNAVTLTADGGRR